MTLKTGPQEFRPNHHPTSKPGKALPLRRPEGRLADERSVIDGVPQDIRDLLRLEVDAADPGHGQRNLLQGVFAPPFGAELGSGSVVEGPCLDAGEVEELSLVVGLQRVQEADDVGLAGDLLVDLPVEGGLPGLVGGLDAASGQGSVDRGAGPGTADDQHRVVRGDEDSADSLDHVVLSPWLSAVPVQQPAAVDVYGLPSDERTRRGRRRSPTPWPDRTPRETLVKRQSGIQAEVGDVVIGMPQSHKRGHGEVATRGKGRW
ncbi:hypothetical protein ACIO8F_06160 [Streptomyces sp. NPDC087228]|uniref:hypothetical protein n=1 Tax=Streptomyces sp. NPDC087228 TaxID=3365772 RepID=UPI0038010486